MELKRLIMAMCAMLLVVVARGEGNDKLLCDSIPHLNVNLNNPTLGVIKRTVRGFGAIDTNYVEPQHYNWAFMIQNTYNYDVYWLKSGTGQEVLLSPDVLFRIGPYFGWRWIFLGTTFELKNIGVKDNKLKKEFTLSLYSAQIGVDLYYRRTGNDYKIRRASICDETSDRRLRDVPFDGLNVGITGVNAYYIFNHNRFSYPAAFAQSTCQKISCGSWMAGMGYTHHNLTLNHEKLKDVVEKNTSMEVKLDSSLLFNELKYNDLNFSLGYGYNWVFARNWLLGASLSMALAYKWSSGDTKDDHDDFSFKNINIDGVGRLGLVWNNTKWYSGFNLIVHSYNYRKSRFATNNVFGSLNIYCGFNFGLRKSYKKKQK
ncbi:MAG: DUF4421 domain-containing protein [Prevotella sp.]|nr:DUF4421 domain-containing protein [Prevotella sp.]